MFYAVNWVYSVLGKMSFYPMDDAGVCGYNKTKWLKDDEHAIVLGKTKPPKDNIFKNCSLKLAPNEENKNKFLRLRFDSFYINDCDVELEIHQAPSSSPEDTKELVLLNCRSNFPQVLYGEEDHQIHLKLERADKFKVDYNFRINVTCTEGPVESGISSPVIIGLAVGGGVLLLLLLFFLFLFLFFRYKRRPNNQTGNHDDDRNGPKCCSLMSNTPQSPNDDKDAPPVDENLLNAENSPPPSNEDIQTSCSARRT